MVPKAGHLPFGDQPQLFLQHVNDFLDGVRVANGSTNSPQ
jgi:pimeloyl-ACP methyl ester carboxylesterase